MGKNGQNSHPKPTSPSKTSPYLPQTHSNSSQAPSKPQINPFTKLYKHNLRALLIETETLVNGSLNIIKSTPEICPELTQYTENILKEKIISGEVKIPEKREDFCDDLSQMKAKHQQESIRKELIKIKVRDNSFRNVIKSFTNGTRSVEKLSQIKLSKKDEIFNPQLPYVDFANDSRKSAGRQSATTSSSLPQLNMSVSKDSTKSRDHLQISFEEIKKKSRKIRKLRNEMWKRQKLKIEKELQEDEERLQQKEKQKEMDRMIRRERIIKKLESKELQDSRVQSETSMANKIYGSGQKRLYERLENDFKRKYVLPELNKSRDILRKRREQMKPINRTELVKHEKKYITCLEKKLKSLEKDRKIKIKKNYKIFNPSKYKTKLAQQMKEKKFFEEIEASRAEKREKMIYYAKLVSESYRPQISLK